MLPFESGVGYHLWFPIQLTLLSLVLLIYSLIGCVKKKQAPSPVHQIPLSQKSKKSTRAPVQSGEIPPATNDTQQPSNVSAPKSGPLRAPTQSELTESMLRSVPKSVKASRLQTTSVKHSSVFDPTQPSTQMTHLTQMTTKKSQISSITTDPPTVEKSEEIAPPPLYPMSERERRAARRRKKRTLKPVPRRRRQRNYHDSDLVDETQRSITPEIIEFQPTSELSKNRGQSILRKPSNIQITSEYDDESSRTESSMSESRRSIRFADDVDLEESDMSNPVEQF